MGFAAGHLVWGLVVALTEKTVTQVGPLECRYVATEASLVDNSALKRVLAAHAGKARTNGTGAARDATVTDCQITAQT